MVNRNVLLFLFNVYKYYIIYEVFIGKFGMNNIDQF